MRKILNFKIKLVDKKDREWVRKFIIKRWGSEKIVVHGQIFYPHRLHGFIAFKDKKNLGLVTYHISDDICEIVTIDSSIEGKGIGTALTNKVKEIAQNANCKRVLAITTNDNINALRFYQKRGFIIKKIYPNAVEKSRKIKPEIPLIGNYGVPIRDEIELEMVL